MINGAHAILYSDNADATRTALAKVLGTRSVDAGGGWADLRAAPGRARRPPGRGGRPGRAVPSLRRRRRHRGRLQAEGIEIARPISDQGWGLLTAITLPGGIELGLYQPSHPTAAQPT
jgi:hypothetical protein